MTNYVCSSAKISDDVSCARAAGRVCELLPLPVSAQVTTAFTSF